MTLSYFTGGNKVIIKETSPWVVLVASPIMMRAQKLSTAGEIIFVDTTSTVDMTSSNVTLVLTATKVGAIPLCILLHESQTKECYTQAFSVVKDTFPNCFGGGKEVIMKGGEKHAGTILADWAQSTHIFLASSFFRVQTYSWQTMQKRRKSPLMMFGLMLCNCCVISMSGSKSGDGSLNQNMAWNHLKDKGSWSYSRRYENLK